MQFNQPIYTSQLMYELLGVDGVRGVNDIRIVQDFDISNNGIPNPSTDLFSFTYLLDKNGGTVSEGRTFDVKLIIFDSFLVGHIVVTHQVGDY